MYCPGMPSGTLGACRHSAGFVTTIVIVIVIVIVMVPALFMTTSKFSTPCAKSGKSGHFNFAVTEIVKAKFKCPTANQVDMSGLQAFFAV